MKTELVTDDHATSRVPMSARRSWVGIAVQRFGQMSDLTQFLLGATLGFGMTFWNAFWALVIGSVIFESISIVVGIIGVREGLNTSLLARWTGFGRYGAGMLAAIITISAIGWFGIQTGISAEGLHQLMPGLSVPVWALLFGLFVTLFVLRGIESMQWIANLTVPLFLLIVGWAVVKELSGHSIPDLLTDAAPGPHLDMITASTLVAGSFLVGAVITTDMTRYNKSPLDVVKQTVIGMTLGEFVIGLAGVLLAHALKSADISAIIFTSVGWIGVLVIVLGTTKINDWNLYSSSLSIVNIADSLLGIRLHRGWVTLAIGALGSVLAAVGILDRFMDFLMVLGVVFPPVAGIMIVEYFLVRRWRGDLEESLIMGRLPVTTPGWVPGTLIAWAAGSLCGQYLQWGMPPVTSIVVAAAVYLVIGKAGLLRSYGDVSTESDLSLVRS